MLFFVGNLVITVIINVPRVVNNVKSLKLLNKEA